MPLIVGYLKRWYYKAAVNNGRCACRAVCSYTAHTCTMSSMFYAVGVPSVLRFMLQMIIYTSLEHLSRTCALSE